MYIPVLPPLQLEAPAGPLRLLKNTRFFLLLGDGNPALSEGRRHPGLRPPARAAPPTPRVSYGQSPDGCSTFALCTIAANRFPLFYWQLKAP